MTTKRAERINSAFTNIGSSAAGLWATYECGKYIYSRGFDTGIFFMPVLVGAACLGGYVAGSLTGSLISSVYELVNPYEDNHNVHLHGINVADSNY